MTGRPSRAHLALVVGACCLALAACGDQNEARPAVTADEPLGEGGSLTWVVAERIRGLDPLAADTRAEQLLTRQIHEPLTAPAIAPYGEGEARGLARARPSPDAAIWTLRLRRNVRFQDGTPFNAAAVLANAERWRESEAGRTLLPSLVEVFAPRFDEVRFILAGPDPSFDTRLDDPRLGIVAPAALRGNGTFRADALDTGTGAFELRERSPCCLLLARNTSWWGAGELGPALDQVELRHEPSATVRLALLDAGDAQLADGLGAEQAGLARSDPLLELLPTIGDDYLGLRRSVRGIESAREIPALAGVWLTTLAASG